MEDLTAFSAKEVKGIAIEKKEKKKYFSAERQCEYL